MISVREACIDRNDTHAHNGYNEVICVRETDKDYKRVIKPMCAMCVSLIVLPLRLIVRSALQVCRRYNGMASFTFTMCNSHKHAKLFSEERGNAMRHSCTFATSMFSLRTSSSTFTMTGSWRMQIFFTYNILKRGHSAAVFKSGMCICDRWSLFSVCTLLSMTLINSCNGMWLLRMISVCRPTGVVK